MRRVPFGAELARERPKAGERGPVRALYAFRSSSAGSVFVALRQASNAFCAAMRERSNASSPVFDKSTLPASSVGIVPAIGTFRLVSRIDPFTEMRPYHVPRGLPSLPFTILNPILAPPFNSIAARVLQSRLAFDILFLTTQSSIAQFSQKRKGKLEDE